MARQMVGFDIGQCEVKIVHTVGGRIKHAVSAPLPDNLVVDGVIRSMDAMGDFLRQCAKENGIPKTHAAVVLPESLAFSRTMTLPAMTAAQLKYNLPYEFKDYLSHEKEKYFYDYAVLGTGQDAEGRPEMELFACATLKKTIADYRAMFRRAGFKLAVAVPEQWAFASAFGGCKDMEGPHCFVDLGHTSTRVQVIKDGRPDSRRTVNVGLEDLDRVIADQFHVDVHMARTYKLSGYEGALELPASQSLYERMAVEILKTVNFYNYNNRELSLQSLCLCGGGAAIEPLRQAVSRVTNLEIKPLEAYLPELAGKEYYLKAFGCAVSL